MDFWGWFTLGMIGYSLLIWWGVWFVGRDLKPKRKDRKCKP